MKSLLLALLTVAGCSSDKTGDVAPDAPSPDAAPPIVVDAGPVPTVPPPLPIAFTSTAFAEGGVIPTDNTCNGANMSPPLAWTGAPAGTKSFAIALYDEFFSPPLVHWVIYDIPASATGVPAGIANTDTPANVPGATQLVSVHSPTIGYYGPCPSNPPAHHYLFALSALDVEHLPGITKDSSRDAAILAIYGHQLNVGNLSGDYTTPK